MILFMVFGVLFTVLTLYYGTTKIEADPDLMNPFLSGTYVILIITVLFALAFPVMALFSDFRAKSRMLLAFAGLIIVFFISYALASGTPEGAKAIQLFDKHGLGTVGSKMIGGGLILTYILVGAAVLATIYASFSTMFKK